MRLKAITISALVVTVLAGTALAHKGAMGIVKVRMDAMSAIADNMKSISEILSGKVAFNGELVAKYADEISGHAANFPDHFKEELEDKFTEAAPEIWKQPEEFSRLSLDMALFAQVLSNNATDQKDSGSLRADFDKIAQTCKSCHEKFRVKK